MQANKVTVDISQLNQMIAAAVAEALAGIANQNGGNTCKGFLCPWSLETSCFSTWFQVEKQAVILPIGGICHGQRVFGLGW